MIKKFFNRYSKNIKDNKGENIPLLGVSIIIFVLTVAVYFVADYVITDFTRGDSVYNWNYGYTERVDKIPDAELRVYNTQNPFVTEKSVKRSNIYLVKTFEPSDENRNLVIRTDHSPIMVKVNGKIVYDDQYKQTSYVANSYNSVELEGSSREQVVEVFMKLPFSVRFEASVENGAARAFAPNLRFFAGAFVFVLGIAALLFYIFIAIRKKRLFRSLTIGVLVAYTGAAVMIGQLPEITYYFNSPFLLNIGWAILHTAFILGLICTSVWLRHRKNLIIAVGFAGVISAAAYLAAVSPDYIGLSAFISTAVTAAAAFYISSNAAAYVLRRTQYAAPVFVIGVYQALIIIVSGVFMFNRNASMYTYTISVPCLVAAGTMGWIFFCDYRYNEKNSEINRDNMRYVDLVNTISEFIHIVLLCKSEETFYKTTAEGICGILLKYDPSFSDVKYGVAVRKDGVWQEVLNNGLGECDYEISVQASAESDKGCLFSDTFFDFVLRLNDGTVAVMHFENLTNGLSMRFVSMIETAYCGLEIAYEKACDSDGCRDINIIFSELALNSEIDNGYSPEHLEHIGKYSYALCRKLGMSEEEATKISLASKLHDVGKIAIPKSVLNKEGKLTEEEQTIVAGHANFGYLILSPYDDDPLLAVAAEIARYHHERYDGTGVNGLQGEKIPLIARITTICDVYDALVSERSYKKAWSKERALAFIDDNSGVMFDPKLIAPFKECLKESESD